MTHAGQRADEGRDVLTRDGRVARVRPLRPTDTAALQELHRAVGEDTLRLRFFSTSRRSALDYVAHLADGPEGALCLVALLEGRVVGVASAEPAGADTMEVAFLLADDQHGRGLGSLLLEHLVDAARALGIGHFVADVLVENVAMQRVFADAGLTLSRAWDDGVSRLLVDLTPTARALEASDAREGESESRSLAPLLRPRSVVVLGVRRDGTGLGAAVLHSILDGRFPGPVDVVHPAGGLVAGREAVRRCADLPAVPDLAVVAVPAAAVLDAVADVAAAGIPAVVVVSSGFGELGADGARRQRDLTRLARDHSVRLVGPNCLGLMSNVDGVLLNATFTTSVPRAGGVAVASQSGGVGIVLLERARSLGLGVGWFVSLGNKADVSGNDLLAAWLDDPGVRLACLYLESFGNAHKFARLARRFASAKPLLAVVGGRSVGGRRAGASHTAAAASDAVLVDALLAHTGVLRCRDAEDMTATALLLDEQPLPAGPRLGIVTNAGGMGVLAADLAAELRLSVPTLTQQLQDRLLDVLSTSAGSTNPVDTGAGAGVDQLVAAAREVITSGEVDALLVVLVGTTLLDVPRTLAALSEMRVQAPDLPAVLVALGVDGVGGASVDGFTVMAGHEEALRALAHAADRAEWLRHADEHPAPPDLARAQVARTRVVRWLEAAPERPWLSLGEARALLGSYDVEVVGEEARGAAGAARAAARQGFPVALKLAAEDGRHKTEGGYVRVGLGSAAAVRRVVADWTRRQDRGVRGPVATLVQPVVSGVEIGVGLVRDPVVGPVLMVAAGGVDIDVWDDRAFLLAPVTPAEVERALRSLRVWRRLEGHRGSPAVDVTALVEVICSLGTLAAEVPEVSEIDLNPVVVTESGAAVVDVRIGVRHAGGAESVFGSAPALGRMRS